MSGIIRSGPLNDLPVSTDFSTKLHNGLRNKTSQQNFATEFSTDIATKPRNGLRNKTYT